MARRTITATVEVELEVEVEYDYIGADPSVGIMSGGAEDITVIDVLGFRIAPTLKPERAFVKDAATGIGKLEPTGEFLLSAKIIPDDELHAKIVELLEDQIQSGADEIEADIEISAAEARWERNQDR